MDDADRAKDYEMAERSAAIQKQQQRAHEIDRPLYVRGVRVCLDCLDPIPDERIEAKPDAVRCTFCKEIHERREAMR